MKIIIPFLATIFLAGMTFAQEESASPAESAAPTTEEKASATVEETPAAKEAKAAAPAAEKNAEATKAASPATAQKKEAVESSAKPATAAAASTSKTAGKNMNPRDAENAWEAAIAKHDFAFVEGMVAPDFTGVTSRNKFANRSQMLSELKGDKDTYKSAKK